MAPTRILPATPTPLSPTNPTAVPTLSAVPLTESGCCARPWWSADGSQVLYVDDPPGDSPLGIYAVSPNGGSPRLFSATISEDVISSTTSATSITGLDLPEGARGIRVSPSGREVAWTEGSSEPVNVDRRSRSVWVSQVSDGKPARVSIVIGGDLVGWAGDGAALIVTGRLSETGPAGVWRMPLDGTQPLLLARGDRPRSSALSPSGGWLVFYLALEDDATLNGVWIVETGGGVVRRLSALASYRWGREGQLLYIPYAVDRPVLALYELDLEADTTSILLDGDAFPGGIASNDWIVSPDGTRLVYRSASDGRLWVENLRGD